MRLFLLGQCSDQRVEGAIFFMEDDTPPPLEADPLFAKRSFKVASIVALHAENHTYIHYIITLPV
jgi:hypothetical protein